MQHDENCSSELNDDGRSSYGYRSSNSLQAVNLSDDDDDDSQSEQMPSSGSGNEIEEVNPSIESVLSSCRGENVLEELKKLQITPKNEFAVGLLRARGVLDPEQVTHEEIEEPIRRRINCNTTGNSEELEEANPSLASTDSEYSSVTSVLSSCGENQTERKVLIDHTSSVRFSLRNYQKELAKPALEGKNTIVCAPSGCGKTMVAIEIIIKHLEGNAGTQQESKSKKVCFFARTIPLAYQQFDTIRKHMPKHYKVDIFTGETNQTMELCQFDIVVLTPMILQNHITRKNVKDIRVFSLLVFDECHHTLKKEPYNLLMSSYVDMKLEEKSGLPQVVGLTASFPVEQPKNDQDAVNAILKLCANLDTHVISDVVEHKAALEDIKPHSMEEIKELTERDTGESSKKINEVMKELEKLAEVNVKEINVKEIVETVSELRKIGNRKNLKYNNLAMDLWNALLHLPRSPEFTKSRPKYHSVLETLELVHIQDVMKYLKDRFAEYKFDKLQTDGEIKLYRYFEDLLQYSENHLYNEVNPNLDLLVNAIDDKLLKMGPSSSRGIVFVKTRAIAEALVLWLNRCEREEIKNLKASIFTGTNAKESLGGMTRMQQESVLKKFREGVVRLLISTSVGEEGLDIPDCNLVISYNCVGNVVSSIQTRGRSRTLNGHSVLLAMPKNCKQESDNKTSAIRMYKGIEIVKKMSSENFDAEINRYQEEDKRKRAIERDGLSKSQQKYRNKTFTMECKWCGKFSISSADLRTINGSHRVVIDRDVWNDKKAFICDPKYLNEIKKVGTVRCDREVEPGATCRGPLGALVYYREYFFLAVAIKNFTIKEENQEKQISVKKWKELLYPLQELSTQDIHDYIGEKKNVYVDQETEPPGTSHMNFSAALNTNCEEGIIPEKQAEMEQDESENSQLPSYSSSDTHHQTKLKEFSSEEQIKIEQGESENSQLSSYSSSDTHHETKPKEFFSVEHIKMEQDDSEHFQLSPYSSSNSHNETKRKEIDDDPPKDSDFKSQEISHGKKQRL